MKTPTIKTLFHLLAVTVTVSADVPSFKDALGEALYAENVARDLDAAGDAYGRMVDSIRTNGLPAEGRAHAATALFRLAEIRERQGRDDESTKLYKEFMERFPDQGHQLALAKERLGIKGLPPRQKLTKVTGEEEGDEVARISENIFRDRWHFTRTMRPDELVLTTFKVEHHKDFANEGLPPEFEVRTLHYTPAGRIKEWFAHTQVFWTKEELRRMFEDNKKKGRAEWRGNDRRNSISGFCQTFVVPDDLHYTGGGWGDAGGAFVFTNEYSVREDGADDYVKVKATKGLKVGLMLEGIEWGRAEALLAAPLKLKLPEMGNEAWSVTLPVSPAELEANK